MDSAYPVEPEGMLCALADVYAAEGRAREVAVLANAQASFRLTRVEDDYGYRYHYFDFHIETPTRVYGQIADVLPDIEQDMLARVQSFTRPYPFDRVSSVYITPSFAADGEWRDRARAFAAGQGTTNQGRVRSSNIAALVCDGLLFRSQQEINLYRALKAQGVSFAPLPVFIRGGKEYRRIEPDFVIVKDGIAMVVEVDGDTVHQESPAEAHARLTMLQHEGVHVERVKASECGTPELAAECARRLVGIVARLKATR